MRDITNSSPSKVSRMPASPPIKVDLETRRTSLMVIMIRSVPKIKEANRQPKEFMPKSCSPPAINHLPSGGCTTKAAVSFMTSTLPAMILELASLGQSRS